MNHIQAAINEIDQKIADLQDAREGLLRVTTGAVTGRGRANRAAGPSIRPKRTMSPEARKRIADAQRARWAETRKAAATPTPKKKKVASKRAKKTASPKEGQSAG